MQKTYARANSTGGGSLDLNSHACAESMILHLLALQRVL